MFDTNFTLLRICRLICFLAVLFFGLFACRATPDLTLEDAQEISAADEQDFTPPPRVGVTKDLINPKFLSNVNEPCKDEPPEPVDIERIVEDARASCQYGGYGYDQKYCLADTLFMRGRDVMHRGYYTDAIAIIKIAISKSIDSQAQRYIPYLTISYAAIGDFASARWYMGGGNATGWSSQSGTYQVMANYQVGKAALARLEGNYRDAEKHYRKARSLCQKAFPLTGHMVFNDTESLLMPDLGEVLMMQGKLLEAELVLRDGLRRFLFRDTFNTNRMRSLAMLGRLYYRQGRYSDAEFVTRAAIGAYRYYYFKCSVLDLNLAHHVLAKILLAQGRELEALKQFQIIRQNMRHTPEIFNIRFANDPDWAFALLASGQHEKAESILTGALTAARNQYGDKHHLTAEIRGLLAVAQYRQSKNDEAQKNLNAALPVLLKYSRTGDALATAKVAFNRRLARIIEAYLAYTAASQTDRAEVAEKTFSLADAIRGQSVQRAVAASSIRIAAREPRLSDLVRREQDAAKKIAALKNVLLNAKSQTAGGRERAADLHNKIEQIHLARAVIIDEIEKDFPDYTELTRPRPKKLSEVKAALKPDEVLLAFYIGNENVFIWAIAGQGPSSFEMLPVRSSDIRQRVKAIRQSLEPKGPQLSDLPRFDLRAAWQLYQGLLEPVDTIWKDARHLLIVPHGQLGHLPFALLPTANKLHKTINKLPLAGYRKVPWLIRDHSITVLPSSGSLLTLRQQPDPDPNRRAFAGFGDPVFNQSQATLLAENQVDSNAILTRAIRITEGASLDEGQLTSATLEMLQPLPDTREEVLSIAAALEADMEGDVFLGSEASESNLKAQDLSNRRVLVFATHGLVPGDLDGLRQPALALSSPQVTKDTNNDGLLTMGEIMGLRLNADWVVLSACNTAAGQGAGSDAVSGMGQAFFYAGTRALLVSNWPVESASARMLTTELFRQQEADPTLSRAVALQGSMLKLLDEAVYKDPQTGEAVFAYAHPIFWAPFSLVGEGG